MRILLADDEHRSRQHLANFLQKLGHTVIEAANGEEAYELFQTEEIHLILTDIRMPKMSGLELLKKIRSLPHGQTADIVMFTAYGDVNTAIEALRFGVYDYLLKPVNIKELVSLTERISEHQALVRENRILTHRFEDAVQRATEETRKELDDLKRSYYQNIGKVKIGVFSDSMKNILEQAQKLHQDRSIPVLIEGETGTGKELIARVIHFGEAGIESPFIDINCAALAPSIFESELFGYEAGAFTGGLPKGQRGKLDIARGGSLFLDEISEIQVSLQAKLLRVIQEKEFYRVGGLKKIKTDVRIMCATNVELERKVEAGEFRRDLFHRLNVARIHIPALRERREDILPLAQMFMREISAEKKRHFSNISDGAAQILTGYPWPGNVRELKNVIEWVVLMWDDVELKPRHLGILNKTPGNVVVKPEAIVNGGDKKTIEWESLELPLTGVPLETINNIIIAKALDKHDGNKTETAKYLGISLRSLAYRLKQIGM